jgi:hypothetical protein
LPQNSVIPSKGGTIVRALLAFLIGTVVLGGCAAKQGAGSVQAVSTVEDKDRAACVEQSLNNKQTSNENQNSFASCMRAKGYKEFNPSDTTANAGKPLGSDDVKSAARESIPSLGANEDYERAVANYNNCVLDHTSNLNACDKQRAIMNGLGKLSSRSSLSNDYEPTPKTRQTTNSASITQGANTPKTTEPTSSQMPARIPPAPQEAVITEPAPPDARITPTPTPF